MTPTSPTSVRATPLVSVVMPAYNAVAWLEQAMTSMLVQTHRELELIVVDDASSDATPELIRSFRDSRVVHHRLEKNGGVGRALNAGLAVARGSYVARMDADDYALPHRLERQVAELEARPELGVLGANAQEVTGTGITTRPRYALFSGRGLHWVVNLWCPLIHPSVVMRRSIIPARGYPAVDTQMEDWAMWLGLARQVTFDNLLEPLIIYRRHPGAVSLERKQRPPGWPIMQAHLRDAFGLDVEATTAATWMRPENAAATVNPAELARVAQALSPDVMPMSAHVPAWRPGELARALRTHARWLVKIAGFARRRPLVVAKLAPVIAAATAKAAVASVSR